MSKHRPFRRAVVVAAALLVANTATAWAQNFVAGRVTDARTLQPIMGAQIVVEGTTVGGLSDAQGRFRIENLPAATVTLRVQMLGFRSVTQEVRAGDANVRFALQETAVELDQIVVTGTAGGTQKRALGNTIATVNAAQVQSLVPAADVTRLLNGRAPGVQVAPGTGMVGAGPRIRIRGAKSLSLSDQPLIYVDGVRVDNDIHAGPKNQGYGSGSVSRLGDFSPDDIESIEVIKGPAAATLYGTEASAGVVQIITKKGRTDSPAQWELITRQGANWFHNPEGRVPLNWGLDSNGQLRGVNLVKTEADRGTPVFRTGQIQEYALNVTGGSGTTRYYLSGKYENAEGIDINNDVWRYSARANLGFTPSSKWDVNSSFGFIKSDAALASDIGSGTLFNLMFSTNVDTEGPRRGFRSAPPEAFRARALAHQLLNRFTGSVQVVHRPWSFFTQRLVVGHDETNERNTTLNPFLDQATAAFFSRAAALGSKSTATVGITYNTVDYGATARFDLSDSWSTSTSVGGQYYRQQRDSLDASGSEFTGPGLTTITGTARRTVGEESVENVTMGTFVQQEVSWRDRVFVTGAVRVLFIVPK